MKLRVESLGRRPAPVTPPEVVVADEITVLGADPDRLDADERAALADRIEAFVAPFEPPVAVLDGVRALREPSASIVVTTIEPGFLGGTLGDFVASLQTIRVARSLAAATERPVVPLVWNDGDAHAKARVHPARFLNDHANLRRVGLSSVSSRATVPHAGTTFDEETHRLGAARALLHTLLARSSEREGALATWFPRAGETWSGAVTRALFDALGSLGLVVVEPAGLRVELARATADLLSPPRDHVDLTAFEPGQAVAYRFGPRGREALRVAGRELRFDDEPGSRTAVELAASIIGAPEEWCPGEALLPLAQEQVLPIAGRVIAPTNMRALAPAGAIGRAIGRPLAPVVARADVAIVEPEIARALQRTETELATALGPGRLVDEAPPPDSELVQRLDELAEHLAADLGRIRAELRDEDRVLDHGLRRTARRLRSELGKARERARRIHANRTGKSRQNVRRIEQHLRPDGEPQADVCGPLALQARWGPGIATALLDVLVAVPPAPIAVFVEPDDA